MDRRARPSPESPAAARDAALGRLRRLRAWLAIASFGAAGILAGIVAQAKPGKATVTTSSGSSEHRAPTVARSAAPQAPAPQLAPPPANPAPAPATPAPAITSGGS